MRPSYGRLEEEEAVEKMEASPSMAENEDWPTPSHRLLLNERHDDATSSSVELVHLRNSVRRLQRILYSVLAIVPMTIVILLLFGFHSSSKPLLVSPITALLKTPVPPLPLEVIKFTRSPLFAQRPNAASDAAWDTLLPPGRGFVYVNNSVSYDLPPGQDVNDGEIYSVSMFHQLHCLGQIRKYYWVLHDALLTFNASNVDDLMANREQMKEGKDKRADTAFPSPEAGQEVPNPTIDDHDFRLPPDALGRFQFLLRSSTLMRMLLGDGGDHVHHCFDYLRQGVTCAGDMSIEWPRVEKEGRRFAVDGWDIPHVCRSQDGIRDYMDKAGFKRSMKGEIAPD